MKRTAWIVGPLALVLSLSAGSVAAAGTATLNGSFAWDNDDGTATGDIEAVFTETGEGTWDVAFHFMWEGEPKVFAGTAEGSLSAGELKGQVLNETKEHTFTFAGSFEGTTFNGTHAALRDGEEKGTGRLTLER